MFLNITISYSNSRKTELLTGISTTTLTRAPMYQNFSWTRCPVQMLAHKMCECVYMYVCVCMYVCTKYTLLRRKLILKCSIIYFILSVHHLATIIFYVLLIHRTEIRRKYHNLFNIKIIQGDFFHLPLLKIWTHSTDIKCRFLSTTLAYFKNLNTFFWHIFWQKKNIFIPIARKRNECKE